MNNSVNYINSEGIKFLGRVNASISHELKNILAIISETTGFLNDVTELAKQGKTLELSMIKNCNDSIAEEIHRGFATIRQMNRFAHSVDAPIEEIDFMDTLEDIIKLSKLLSFASDVEIKTIDDNLKPVLTCPLLIQNLIYHILSHAYELIDSNEKLHISVSAAKSFGIYLIFSDLPASSLQGFLTRKIKEASDILGTKLDTTSVPTQLGILIPYNSMTINKLISELKY